MKTTPTLADHMAGSHQADMAHYQAILAEIRADLKRYAPQLQASAQPFLDDFLAPGEFSQVVALLPYWVNDLAPVSSDICHQLGVAHLYGWWYYAAQDELLDGDAAPTVILAAHLALLKMVDGYRTLGIAETPCWAEWDALAQTSAAAYATEMQTRFTDLTDLTPDRLAPWTVDFIINRAAPFYFNTMAQLYLANIPADSPLHHALPTAISYFGAARQISDDAGDWLDDLKNGHLNFISAGLIQYLYEEAHLPGSHELDLDRLAGQQIRAEPFWETVEATAQSLAQQALDLLAPFGDCKLVGLIRYQMSRNAESWATGRARRQALREVFGVKGIPWLKT